MFYVFLDIPLFNELSNKLILSKKQAQQGILLGKCRRIRVGQLQWGLVGLALYMDGGASFKPFYLASKGQGLCMGRGSLGLYC